MQRSSSLRYKEKMISSRRSQLVVAWVLLAFVLGLGAGYMIWGRSIPAAITQQDTTGLDSQPSRRFDVPVDDDPSLGPENAAVTIVEFSDYECPFCTKWHFETWPQIQAAYGDQVRLVYRDFPLSSIHGNAASAAEAAHCAGEQNAYWEYHSLLFSAQLGLGSDAYNQYATDLSLDLGAFNECLSSRRYQEEVQADLDFAVSLGVQSTPTFFINGIAVVGAQPFEAFKQVIDRELAGE